MSLLLRIVAILQIAGGFYGLFQLLPVLLIGRASLILMIGIILSGLALIAGVLLMEYRASGVRLSRVVQFLQIPLLALPGFSYSWHVGAALPLTTRLSPSFALDLDLALVSWLVLWSRR